MTLRKSKGRKRRLCCDHAGCKAEYGPPFDKDFVVQLVGLARGAGWKVTKTPLGLWRHECPAHDDGEQKPAARAVPHGQRFRADIDG